MTAQAHAPCAPRPLSASRVTTPRAPTTPRIATQFFGTLADGSLGVATCRVEISTRADVLIEARLPPPAMHDATFPYPSASGEPAIIHNVFAPRALPVSSGRAREGRRRASHSRLDLSLREGRPASGPALLPGWKLTLSSPVRPQRSPVTLPPGGAGGGQYRISERSTPSERARGAAAAEVMVCGSRPPAHPQEDRGLARSNAIVLQSRAGPRPGWASLLRRDGDRDSEQTESALPTPRLSVARRPLSAGGMRQQGQLQPQPRPSHWAGAHARPASAEPRGRAGQARTQRVRGGAPLSTEPGTPALLAVPSRSRGPETEAEAAEAAAAREVFIALCRSRAEARQRSDSEQEVAITAARAARAAAAVRAC